MFGEPDGRKGQALFLAMTPQTLRTYLLADCVARTLSPNTFSNSSTLGLMTRVQYSSVGFKRKNP